MNDIHSYQMAANPDYKLLCESMKMKKKVVKRRKIYPVQKKIAVVTQF